MKRCNKNCFECPYEDCRLEIDENDSNFKFVERLALILDKKGYSQSDLARNTKIKYRTINQYCTGSRSPSLEQIFKICKFLKVSVDYLIGFEDV